MSIISAEAEIVKQALAGNFDAVLSLLKKGASPNSIDKDGWTCLHAASYRGHLRICQLMATKEANMNFIDNEGWTALHWAARYGHTEVCVFLMEENLDVLQKNKFNETAIDKARQGRHPKIAKILEAGAGAREKKQAYLLARKTSLEARGTLSPLSVEKPPSNSSLKSDEGELSEERRHFNQTPRASVKIPHSEDIVDWSRRDGHGAPISPLSRKNMIPSPLSNGLSKLATTSDVDVKSHNSSSSELPHRESVSSPLHFLASPSSSCFMSKESFVAKGGRSTESLSNSISDSMMHTQALDAILKASPLAYDFWVQNFDIATSVLPMKRFLFALEVRNTPANTIALCNVMKLDEIDIHMFKIMLNGPLKDVFSETQAVKPAFGSPDLQPNAASILSLQTLADSLSRNTAANAKPSFLLLFEKKNADAYNFWMDNFLSADPVDKETFNMAISICNAKKHPIVDTELDMVDLRAFNIMCNGPLKILFPTA